jgi:hypothetical protein
MHSFCYAARYTLWLDTYSLHIGIRRRLGQDLSQTLGL